MIKRNRNDYFEMLSQMTECACMAADKLHSILQKFDKGELRTNMAQLHEVESAGDKQKHLITGKLAKEFITPIDREDLFAISGEIDEVIDNLEDVLLKIYIFNIQSLRDDALEFASLLKHCCAELLVMMKEFVNYKKSTTIHNLIVEINRLEEDGDKMYLNAVRKLYTENGDPVTIMAWTEVYNTFEKCFDSCEHVANLVENMIMKNI